eukprot:SAG11_NODE_16079_length_557_cov_1.159389_1_plen_57_part_10
MATLNYQLIMQMGQITLVLVVKHLEEYPRLGSLDLLVIPITNYKYALKIPWYIRDNF